MPDKTFTGQLPQDSQASGPETSLPSPSGHGGLQVLACHVAGREAHTPQKDPARKGIPACSPYNSSGCTNASLASTSVPCCPAARLPRGSSPLTCQLLDRDPVQDLEGGVQLEGLAAALAHEAHLHGARRQLGAFHAWGGGQR